MKHSEIKKLILGVFLLVFGVTLVPTAQAHDGDHYQHQFDNGRYQYQVHTLPVQTQYQTYQQSYQRSRVSDQDVQLLLQQIAQLQRLLLQLQAGRVVIDDGYNQNPRFSDDSEVEVETRSAADIRYDSARLRGFVSDFNRSDFADVWFEYGRSHNDLDLRTPIISIDEDEDEEFDFQVNRLRDDERYYFRAVAEDDDQERDYGIIEDFQTRDRSRDNRDRYNRNDEKPDVFVQNTFAIEDDSAWFEGSVDMNDFRDGEVFFVYGEDESQIEDVAFDYDSYRDVDEDGDDLQKFRLDSDLDGNSSYEARVTGLDDNTDYYYALCVGYEDEDNDDVLECSSTRDFETD